MLTADIKQYRRNYYITHKDYLLAYSKWYYSNLKFLKGQISDIEVRTKPPKEIKPKKNKRKPPAKLEIVRGSFMLTF